MSQNYIVPNKLVNYLYSNEKYEKAKNINLNQINNNFKRDVNNIIGLS